MISVTCDYCGASARLVDGGIVYPHRPDLNRLKFWYCDNGHSPAYVGCHKKNSRHGWTGVEPLGRLADSNLRFAKSTAHSFFDLLWKDGVFKSRKRAYKWLAQELGIKESECHIGMFNEDMCEKVVDACMRIEV